MGVGVGVALGVGVGVALGVGVGVGVGVVSSPNVVSFLSTFVFGNVSVIVSISSSSK